MGSDTCDVEFNRGFRHLITASEGLTGVSWGCAVVAYLPQLLSCGARDNSNLGRPEQEQEVCVQVLNLCPTTTAFGFGIRIGTSSLNSR